MPISVLRRLLPIVGALLWAAPALAMDAYWTEPGYKDIPLRGPAQAKGLVIWNEGVYGTRPTYQYQPAFLVKGLAIRGWDVIKLDRNPTYENTWTNAGLKHVDRLIEEAEARKKAGYARIILAGQSYGGAIALRAADTFPAYAVIALAPGIGETTFGNRLPTDWDSSAIERATYSQVEDLKASRAVFVLPADDEFVRGVDRAPHVRELMAKKDIPYLLVDRQVHGHGGAYSKDFIPYASCALSLLDPGRAPKPGEYQCFRDEMPAVIAALGFDPAAASAAWVGYVNDSGQELVLLEHDAASGVTVDLGMGQGVLGKNSLIKRPGLAAVHEGNGLSVTLANGGRLTLQADGATAKAMILPPNNAKGIPATLVRLQAGH